MESGIKSVEEVRNEVRDEVRNEVRMKSVEFWPQSGSRAAAQNDSLPRQLVEAN